MKLQEFRDKVILKKIEKKLSLLDLLKWDCNY